MLKIRRSRDRLIFNMGSPYLGKTVFILRRGPGYLHNRPVSWIRHPAHDKRGRFMGKFYSRESALVLRVRVFGLHKTNCIMDKYNRCITPM